MRIGLFDSGSGIIPFIDEIIKQDKRNDYYLYVDLHHFPYGDKSEDELIDILKEVFLSFEKIGIDELLIVCNTMSYVYLQNDLASSFRVKTILDLNLRMYNSSCNLLCTTFLADKLGKFYQVIDGKNLASLIENNDIYEIIKIVKKCKFSSSIILSCTHYSLAKDIFSSLVSNVKFYSYEKEFISFLDSYSDLSFHAFSKHKSFFERHLKNERIKIHYF